MYNLNGKGLTFSTELESKFKELDRRLDFLVKVRPNTFLFIQVSTVKTLNYVCDRITKTTGAICVNLHESDDILFKLKNASCECLVIMVDPETNDLLRRLDFLRDTIYRLNKFLIFVLYTMQFNEVILNYPDLEAYAISRLDYSEVISAPFSLILSGDGLQYSKIKLRTLRTTNIPSNDDMKLKQILDDIDKLAVRRVNSIEVEKLDNAMSWLYNKLNKEDVLNVIIKYLNALAGKEMFELVGKNLLMLHNVMLNKNYREVDDLLWGYLKLMKVGLSTDFEIRLLSKTIKILVQYFVYRNNAEDIKYAKTLVELERQYLLDSNAGFNRIAECYNDSLIIRLIQGDLKVSHCLQEFRFFDSLTLDLKNQFLTMYNKAILLLLEESYEEALSVCDGFLVLYKMRSLSDNDMMYCRMFLIKTWIRGMYERHLESAIESIKGILKEHRGIFPENHYTIAEMHYCNAFMYRELGDSQHSSLCIKKAKNILNQNHSARLTRLRDLVNVFIME